MTNMPMEIDALRDRTTSAMYNNLIPGITTDKLLVDKAFIESLTGKKPKYAEITLLNIRIELKKRKVL